LENLTSLALHQELIYYSVFVIIYKMLYELGVSTFNTIGALGIHWSYPACAARPQETTLFGIGVPEDAFGTATLDTAHFGKSQVGRKQCAGWLGKLGMDR
jgi:hypothetical protein